MRTRRALLPLLLLPTLGAQNTEEKSLAGLLSAASARNTLLAADLPPWHLRAGYQAFGEDGKPEAQGVFEEFHAGPKKDRVGYTSPVFTQTDYLLASGHLRAGNPRWAGLVEQLVRHNLVHPMPNPGVLGGAVLSRGQMEASGKPLSCIAITLPAAAERDQPAQPFYCFDEQNAAPGPVLSPVLRAAGSAGHAFETAYDQPVEFHGHTVARLVHVRRAGKPFLDIHVETLETIEGAQDAVFEPPADAAAPPPQRVRISAALAQAYLREGAAPSYPLLSEHARIEGTVVIQALIGINGRPLQTTVVSTPSKDLATSAIDAIRQWTYRPYLVNGEPAEMVTEIKMQFRLPKK